MDLSEAAVNMATEQGTLANQATGQLDLNDVRLAIGALSQSHRHLRERVERALEGLDDIGALMHRLAAFSALVDDVEAFTDRIPALLRGLANDPMIGMFAAGPAMKLADEFEAHMAQRARQRMTPPAIEG